MDGQTDGPALKRQLVGAGADVATGGDATAATAAAHGDALAPSTSTAPTTAAAPASGSGGFFVTEVDHDHRKAQSKAGARGGAPPDSDDDEAAAIAGTVESVEFSFDPERTTAFPEAVPLRAAMHQVANTITFRTASQKRKWTAHFQLAESKALIEDTFWWVFCVLMPENRPAHVTESHHDSANKLYSRMSDNFAKLLKKTPSDFVDVFLSHYSDAVAQTVFSGLLHSFPRTVRTLDDGFKSTLVKTVSEWTQGLLLTTPNFAHWDMSDPTAKGRGRSRGGGQDAAASVAAAAAVGGGGTKNLKSGATSAANDILALTHSRRRANMKKVHESNAVENRTQRERVAYELSHSGLIKHYLTRKRHPEPQPQDGSGRRGSSGDEFGGRGPSGTDDDDDDDDGAHDDGVDDEPEEILKPPISGFVCKVTLTETVGQPVSTGGVRRSYGRTLTLPGAERRGRRGRGDEWKARSTQLIDAARSTLAAENVVDPDKAVTFADMVAASERSRTSLVKGYSSRKDAVFNDLKRVRNEQIESQRSIAQRKKDALAGDVHEFSNYLVSLWSMTDASGKRGAAAKAAGAGATFKSGAMLDDDSVAPSSPGSHMDTGRDSAGQDGRGGDGTDRDMDGDSGGDGGAGGADGKAYRTTSTLPDFVNVRRKPPTAKELLKQASQGQGPTAKWARRKRK